MLNKLLKFDVPHLYNPHDRGEILCNLEALALSAFYISENDLKGSASMVELELEPATEEYEPVKVYEESYDELIEIVGGYNFFISEHNLNKQPIELVIDDEKTQFLKEGDEFPIYKVVLIELTKPSY